jgi:hypothetical protein
VHRGVVGAAGEGVGARGLGEPGADRGVVERDGRQLGERLERVEVLAAQRDPPAVRDGEHAAQLAAPVHRHGHRRLDAVPRGAGARAADAVVLLGHHRPVGEQHLAREPVARRQSIAEVLGRQAVSGLEREHVRVVVRHAVHHGAVGADQPGRLVADAGQQRAEVGRLVEGLGRACERGVLVGGAAVLEAGGLVGEGGGRRAGEGAGELQGRRVGEVPLGAGEHERTPRTGTWPWSPAREPATASSGTTAAAGSRRSARASAASALASASSPGWAAWVTRATRARQSGAEPS